MKIKNIVVVNDPGRIKPYVTVVWDDDKANSVEIASSKNPLKAIQYLVNLRLN